MTRMLQTRTYINRLCLGSLLALVLLTGCANTPGFGQRAPAAAPLLTDPVQIQIWQQAVSLNNSEAELVLGSYLPGVGAVINMQLVRGPNAVPDKTSQEGTRDWVTYLMQTFGPRLNAVPANEIVSFSVEFYDYDVRRLRHLVITSRAETVGDPNTYQIWLDGQSYAEAVGQTVPSTLATPVGVAPLASARASAQPATSAAGSAVAATAAPAGPVNVTFDFTDPNVIGQNWAAITGQWQPANQGYAQTELSKFDLISYYKQPLAGNYRLATEMVYVAGEMGGGLVFNAPTNTSKRGAHMVSYTAGGSYLHWGYFDEAGVFQFQGGASVPAGTDKQRHTLAVTVSGETYTITLNGQPVTQNVQLTTPPGGYVGLFASTSHVVFNNVVIESAQP